MPEPILGLRENDEPLTTGIQVNCRHPTPYAGTTASRAPKLKHTVGPEKAPLRSERGYDPAAENGERITGRLEEQSRECSRVHVMESRLAAIYLLRWMQPGGRRTSSMLYLVWVVLIGILAGWLAGEITKGRGFGLLGDLIVGILGSLLGSFLFGLIGIIAYGLLGRLVMAVIGAVVLLWLMRLTRRM